MGGRGGEERVRTVELEHMVWGRCPEKCPKSVLKLPNKCPEKRPKNVLKLPNTCLEIVLNVHKKC